MTTMEFYLGTHMPNWLGLYNVPLFVSRRTLYDRKSFPRALHPWRLDSGGFSELSMFGEWRTPAKQYAGEVELFASEIGNLNRASVQDWMCEPFILRKTGLTVGEHQHKTIDSYKRLCDLAPNMPWMPVVQGFELGDYLRHIEMYEQANIDIFHQVMGIGSICRRQHSLEAEIIIRKLAGLGLRLHGFGFKLLGLERVSDVLDSADSMAWSFDARHKPPLPGHTHKNCANCSDFALQWYRTVVQRIDNTFIRPRQLYMQM